MNLNPGSIEDSRLSSESCWLLLCAYVGEGMLVSDGDPCVCRDWVLMQQRIHDHPDFDRWFLEYPEVRRTKNFYDLKFHTWIKIIKIYLILQLFYQQFYQQVHFIYLQ